MIQSPPNELEHIELELINIFELSDYEAVVDAVLWCCRPRSLNITSLFHTIDSEERNQVVKVIVTYLHVLSLIEYSLISIYVFQKTLKPSFHLFYFNAAVKHELLNCPNK